MVIIVEKRFFRSLTLPLRKKHSLLLLTPLIFSHYAYAENHDEMEKDSVQKLKPIVISASRSEVEQNKAPQTIVVLKKEDIQKQLAISSNSSDVLSNLLPSYTPSRGKMNGSGETLRGRTPLIMTDGVPQSNPLRPTGREVHTLDFSMVDRIEVIQGANATNGIGATGGVINIITKRPEDGEINQSLNVQTTMPTDQLSSDTLNYKTDYSVNGRNNNFDYLLSMSYEDQGLYIDGKGRPIGVDNTQGDLMDSRMYNILAKLGYQIDDDQRVQASVNRYQIKGENNYTAVTGDRNAGLPTTSIEQTPPGIAPHNDVWTSSISYEHNNLAGMKLNVMAFNQEFEGLFGADNSPTFQDPRIAPNGTLYDQSRSVGSKFGSKLSLIKDNLFQDHLKLTLGLDTLYDKGKQDLYSTNRTYVPVSRYKSYSPFVQAEVKVLDNLSLHAGARREISTLETDSYTTLARYNNTFVQGGKLDFEKNLFNAGIVYSPLDELTFFANYSEGFGMPDVGRALRAINTPGLSIQNLSNLEPILTENIETGTRVKFGDTSFDLSLFQSSSDFGDRSKYDPETRAFLMAREKTRIRGIDTSVSHQLKNHNLKLSYSYTQGKYDSDENGSLDSRMDGLSIAPNRLVASWGTDWTDKLSSYLQINHAFEKNFDDPNLNFGGYTLVDGVVAYQLPKGTASVSVSNLLDKDYITYYSQSALNEPKRYFAGRGRTLTLGYSIKF